MVSWRVESTQAHHPHVCDRLSLCGDQIAEERWKTVNRGRTLGQFAECRLSEGSEHCFLIDLARNKEDVQGKIVTISCVGTVLDMSTHAEGVGLSNGRAG